MCYLVTVLRLLVFKHRFDHLRLHLANVDLDLPVPIADGRCWNVKMQARLLQCGTGRKAPGHHLLLESTIVLSLHSLSEM